MAVVVNDNTKCQIDHTTKSPPTSGSSPPPLDLGMEVCEVKPVEIEVPEVEPVEVVEPALSKSCMSRERCQRGSTSLAGVPQEVVTKSLAVPI